MVISLILLSLLLISFYKPTSVFIRILLMLVVYSFFTLSVDESDFPTYMSLYDSIGTNGTTGYELLYEWLEKICNKNGLEFIQFRFVTAAITILTLDIAIGGITKARNIVWVLYLVFSALFDSIPIRSSISLGFGAIALVYLIRGGKYNYIISFVLIVVAALFHSSYWAFLGFLPLWYIVNKKGLGFTLAAIMIGYVVMVTAGSLIFDVYSSLSVREATVDKYSTGSYSNITGVIVNTVKYLFVISPTYIIYKYKLAGYQKSGVLIPEVKIKNIFYLNVIFSFLLIPQFFSILIERLFHGLIVFNYVVMANYFVASKKKPFAFIFAVLYALINLAFFMFFQFPNTYEIVFLMHFQTNPIWSNL